MASTGAEDTEHVGWTAQPRGRGTMGLIWSCLSVLILCSYKCIHLNMSERAEVQAGWHKWHSIPYWPEKPLLWKYLRKILWVITIIIAPEIGVGMAVSQYAAACESLIRAGGEPLLPIRDKFMTGDTTLRKETVSKTTREKVTLAHAFYANMGGFAQQNTARADSDRVLHDASLSDYVIFLENATPKQHKLFYLSENDVGGLSKSDGITKVLAILQAGWLVAQSIARADQDLRLSILELTTMAYVLCAVAMYGLWWSKPYDVEHITVFPKPESWGQVQPEPRVRHEGDDEPSSFYFESGVGVEVPDFDIDVMARSRNGTWESPANLEFWELIEILMFDFGTSFVKPLVFRLIATAFAAIHLIAWDWDFPSPVVRTLWRVFSIGCLVNGPILLLGNVIGLIHGSTHPPQDRIKKLGVLDGLVAIGSLLFGLSYIVMRLGLIVLTFYCLSSMPADVYQTVDWTLYFPVVRP